MLITLDESGIPLVCAHCGAGLLPDDAVSCYGCQRYYCERHALVAYHIPPPPHLVPDGCERWQRHRWTWGKIPQ
jgi:hypothetical protein